ncbi:MAG: tetratricopeptide repeat protein [Bacteroidales bacterium]|nr:tetratricopeptide repeat protein [Bacteroidales bacterium]
MAGKRSIGRLIGIMLIVVVAGVLVARSYYGNLNRSVDPRIRQARELYEQYDSYARLGDYHRIFSLLDSIATIYKSTAHYTEAFELGVLHNNRAAALLTITLYRDSIPQSANPYYELETDSVVALAEKQIRKAIALYDRWDEVFSGKSDEEIRVMIESVFRQGLEQTEPALADKYLKRRVSEISEAVVENQRRLSVCYTNLGLVYRTRGEYPEAVAHYEKAMTLWDRNLDAENNLNKLLNRPIKKRNFIQRMFPPSKDASTNK